MPSALTTRCTSSVMSSIWVRRAVCTRIDCMIASRVRSRNGNNIVLAGLFGAGKFLEFAESIHAQPQKERKEGKIAGLKSLVRVEKIFQELGVLLDHLGVAIESGSRLGAQLLDLVADALLGAGDGALNGRVHCADRFVKLLDALFDLPQAAVEGARELLGNIGGVHALAQRLRTEPGILDLQAIFFEDAGGLGIDQGVIGTW